jgi:tetratricopeptide (TPR) repeat protein
LDARKRAEAEDSFRKALAVREQLCANHPENPEYQHGRAAVHANLGQFLRAGRKLDESLRHFREALRIEEELVAKYPAAPVYWLSRANYGVNLGDALLSAENVSAENVAAAETEFRKALGVAEMLVAGNSTAEHRLALARSRMMLGGLLEGLGKFPDAIEQYRKCVDIQETVAKDVPAGPVERLRLTTVLMILGSLEMKGGQFAEAAEHARRATEVCEQLVAEKRVPERLVQLGACYGLCGDVARAADRAEESVPWYDKAIDTLRSLNFADLTRRQGVQYLQNGHVGRAEARHRLEKYAESLQDWDRAVELSPRGQKMSFVIRRANTRARAGKVPEALADVVPLENSLWPPEAWYAFAGVYAIASTKDQNKKQQYADRAMELLHKAAKAGFKDAAQAARDKDLDSLRDRDDFKKLLDSLPRPEKRDP